MAERYFDLTDMKGDAHDTGLAQVTSMDASQIELKERSVQQIDQVDPDKFSVLFLLDTTKRARYSLPREQSAVRDIINNVIPKTSNLGLRTYGTRAHKTDLIVPLSGNGMLIEDGLSKLVPAKDTLPDTALSQLSSDFLGVTGKKVAFLFVSEGDCGCGYIPFYQIETYNKSNRIQVIPIIVSDRKGYKVYSMNTEGLKPQGWCASSFELSNVLKNEIKNAEFQTGLLLPSTDKQRVKTKLYGQVLNPKP